jgi:hypothetical protein
MDGTGWPELPGSHGNPLPGFAVIVGVSAKGNSDPTFHALQGIEDPYDDIRTLLSECVKVRENYGASFSFETLCHWYGDPDRFQSELVEINRKLDKREKAGTGIYIQSPFSYLEQPADFDFARLIKSLLTPQGKRLYLGKCARVKAHIQNATGVSPAIVALGSVIHTLLQTRPWEVPVGGNAFNLEEF